MNRVIMMRTCGHERDVTGIPETQRPAIGEEVACWSSCDRVPTWRGRDNPNIRYVKCYEIRKDEV